jgi:S-adenosylmethionine/arginine decarboxylase-like enzyme
MVQSHVAFHWWPDVSFLHITVSSCRPFNENSVLGWLEQHIPIERIQTREALW